MITIIACIDNNRALGYQGDLLYRIKEDLQDFKRKTIGKTIIMGRKTFESLSKKPLPNRQNIVISRNENLETYGVKQYTSLESAINDISGDIFIIGGSLIYQAALSFADCLDLTFVDAEKTADTFFPEIDNSIWKLEYKSQQKIDISTGLKYYFLKYVRR